MAKKAKDKKISRLVLLGAMEACFHATTAKQRKELSPIINGLLNQYDLKGEAGLAFVDYQSQRFQDAEAEAAARADVPKKLKKPKGKKVAKKKRK